MQGCGEHDVQERRMAVCHRASSRWKSGAGGSLRCGCLIPQLGISRDRIIRNISAYGSRLADWIDSAVTMLTLVIRCTRFENVRPTVWCALIIALIHVPVAALCAQGPVAGVSRVFIEHRAQLDKIRETKLKLLADSAPRTHHNAALIGAGIGCAIGLGLGIAVEAGLHELHPLKLVGLCGFVALPTTVIAALLFPHGK
jgi:hypothetical protein